MKNSKAQPNHHRSSLPLLTLLTLLTFLTFLTFLTLLTTFALAQPAAPNPSVPDPLAFSLQPLALQSPSALQSLLDGLLGKYGWLTTVLLVIGSLRILFKPL